MHDTNVLALRDGPLETMVVSCRYLLDLWFCGPLAFQCFPCICGRLSKRATILYFFRRKRVSVYYRFGWWSTIWQAQCELTTASIEVAVAATKEHGRTVLSISKDANEQGAACPAEAAGVSNQFKWDSNTSILRTEPEGARPARVSRAMYVQRCPNTSGLPTQWSVLMVY